MDTCTRDIQVQRMYSPTSLHQSTGLTFNLDLILATHIQPSLSPGWLHTNIQPSVHIYAAISIHPTVIESM